MTSTDDQERIAAQAANWVVRLGEHGPDASLSPELQHWLGQDPRHAAAYADARATWLEMAELGQQLGLPQAQVVPQLPRRPTRRPLARPLALAACLMVALGLGLGTAQRLATPWLADHATGVGEVRTLILPDGSQVELDARSALDVLFDEDTRRVRLLDGEAIFSVAPMGVDEQRPFVVERRGGSTRALGTRFIVGDHAEGVWVGVLEHSVAVRPGTAGQPAQVLEEGDSAWYDASAVHPLQRNLANATAWREGFLVFEDWPLSAVVERLADYRPGLLLILDAELAERRVSGLFRLDNASRSLDLMVDELGAQRIDLPGLTILR